MSHGEAVNSAFLRKSERPLIFGHRGARAHAPENTLKAFERAIDDGADGVELDVRATACGTLCIHHDRDLKIKGRKVPISQLTYAQILTLRARDETRVCTLEEALTWARTRNCLVNIELKPDGFAPHWMAKEAVKIARKFEKESLLFSSFDIGLLITLKATAPDLVRGLLTETGHPFIERGVKSLPLSFFAGACALHPQLNQFSQSWLAAKIRDGLAVNMWTILDAHSAQSMANLGVNALICDDPAAILNALKSGR